MINKPAVNSFVEVWRLDSEQKKPKRGRKQQDCPKHPVAFERAKKTRRQAILGREKIRSRLFTSAASTRRDAHFSDRRLWFHWEQLYSLHSGTLQAGLRNQRRCAYLCGNLANLAGVAEEHGDRYEFFKADIANADQMDALMTEHQFYAVINFAAESHVDRSINSPQNFIHTNVIGTSMLLDAARLHGVQRFVQISTDEVYGSLGPTGKFTEQSPLEPSSPYSASKAGADLLALACFKTFGQDVVVTRCSNNYGPYQFPEKLMPLMIIKALRNEPLPVYGDGMNVRDWIHVRDHCAGVVAALFEGKAGAVYNFGGDSELPNLEVVKSILDKLCKL